MNDRSVTQEICPMILRNRVIGSTTAKHKYRWHLIINQESVVSNVNLISVNIIFPSNHNYR